MNFNGLTVKFYLTIKYLFLVVKNSRGTNHMKFYLGFSCFLVFGIWRCFGLCRISYFCFCHLICLEFVAFHYWRFIINLRWFEWTLCVRKLIEFWNLVYCLLLLANFLSQVSKLNSFKGFTSSVTTTSSEIFIHPQQTNFKYDTKLSSPNQLMLPPN